MAWGLSGIVPYVAIAGVFASCGSAFRELGTAQSLNRSSQALAGSLEQPLTPEECEAALKAVGQYTGLELKVKMMEYIREQNRATNIQDILGAANQVHNRCGLGPAAGTEQFDNSDNSSEEESLPRGNATATTTATTSSDPGESTTTAAGQASEDQNFQAPLGREDTFDSESSVEVRPVRRSPPRLSGNFDSRYLHSPIAYVDDGSESAWSSSEGFSPISTVSEESFGPEVSDHLDSSESSESVRSVDSMNSGVDERDLDEAHSSEDEVVDAKGQELLKDKRLHQFVRRKKEGWPRWAIQKQLREFEEPLLSSGLTKDDLNSFQNALFASKIHGYAGTRRPRKLYFAFGSNMDERRMRTRGVRVYGRAAAVAYGWRLAFAKRASNKPKEGYATMLRSRVLGREASAVHGYVYEVDDDGLSKLDFYEGVPYHYRQVPLKVKLTTKFASKEAGEDVKTLTYLAAKPMTASGLYPSNAYLGFFISPSARDLMNTEYHEWLKTMETVESKEKNEKACLDKQGRTRVFVYGTLKKGGWNHDRFLNKTAFVGNASTVKNYTMLADRLPYVDQHHFPPASGHIKGEVYAATPAELDMLDKLEGHPEWYCREPVQVNLIRPGRSEEKMWAFLYFSDSGEGKIVHSGDWPEVGDAHDADSEPAST